MKYRWLTFTLIGIAAVLALTGLVYGGGTAASGNAVPRQSPDGQTRVYYVAADEVEWDYAPADENQITGEPFGEEENVFVQHGPRRIGKVYLKAQYREYMDGTFTTLKPVPPEWEHLGILGPVIRAEVGDTIQVTFKNNTRYPQSMHPHGVFYEKSSEGAPYDDGTSGADKDDDAVPPGGVVNLVWQVPERAGPGPMDATSILWTYHGHVDEPGDTNAGLVGPIIITRQGFARPDGSPVDVDREFVTLFTVFDENASLYLDYNIETYAGRPQIVNPDDEDFIESNLMHSINGYVYGNLPLASLTAHIGERVRWYVVAQGTEVDLHTAHWHGNTVVLMGMRTDITELLPMSMKVADMVPDAAGIWLYHCHVNDHISAGMMARYQILP